MHNYYTKVLQYWQLLNYYYYINKKSYSATYLTDAAFHQKLPSSARISLISGLVEK